MPVRVPKVTHDDVIRVVRRDFPPALADEALDILRGYAPEDDDDAQARVRLGILKLAGGDVGLLRQYAELAHIDFRDVLLNAEYPRYAEVVKESLEAGEDPEEVERRTGEEDWAQYQRWLGRRCEPLR